MSVKSSLWNYFLCPNSKVAVTKWRRPREASTRLRTTVRNSDLKVQGLQIWNGMRVCQKIYGLCGLKDHIVEISGDLTDAGRTNNNKWRLSYTADGSWRLSFAKRRADRNNHLDVTAKKQTPPSACNMTRSKNLEIVTNIETTSWCLMLRLPNDDFRSGIISFHKL